MEERIQKLIAASGIASRREAEELIRQGRVRVNGKVVSDLGSKALATDTILVHNKPLPKPQTVVYAVNKPRGVVCSRVKQGNEQLVTDLVPSYPRVYPVGRLDKESEGIILLTNDGELAQKLTHPSFEHKKEYYLKVKWEKKAVVKPLEWLEAQMLKGVKLGDGTARADKVKIKPGKPEELTIDITVHEGRKHLLRRMCATLGLEVTSLRRTKFGTLSLEHLKPGAHRLLTSAERTALLNS
jgi:23S rRNA pseudouridine2605 synthase